MISTNKKSIQIFCFSVLIKITKISKKYTSYVDVLVVVPSIFRSMYSKANQHHFANTVAATVYNKSIKSKEVSKNITLQWKTTTYQWEHPFPREIRLHW